MTTLSKYLHVVYSFVNYINQSTRDRLFLFNSIEWRSVNREYSLMDKDTNFDVTSGFSDLDQISEQHS